MNQKHYQGIGMTSQRTRDRLIARLEEKGISSKRVLEAMRITPRHLFVDEALASRAYEDTALPIGHKQTISQPYVVARMTEAIIKDGILLYGCYLTDCFIFPSESVCVLLSHPGIHEDEVHLAKGEDHLEDGVDAPQHLQRGKQ